MSDEEEVMSEEESEEETETRAGAESPEERAPAKDTGPSEAEVAMLKRRAQQQYGDLDEAAQELLAQNKVEQEAMGREITDMRARRERRMKEREEEERRMAQKRAEEDAKRKAEEEERKRKKEEEEMRRREERDKKMAEMDKLKNAEAGQRNFQITKRGTSVTTAEETSGLPKKSKEELEAEKKAILAQRIQPLEISGFDSGKLSEKAKELHNLILRLEGDKYDLEKRFKAQQRDMLELANKARQINKVGKEGTIKRVGLSDDDVDKIQERFAGAPAKVVMFSEFERQKDKRSYDDKKTLFKGPSYGFPAERIQPHRILKWDENTGQPVYETMEGVEIPADEEAEE